MRIYVNGKETGVSGQLTVAGLVFEKGLDPNTVVVEHNRVILPKEKWTEVTLASEDRLEIITFVGGG